MMRTLSAYLLTAILLFSAVSCKSQPKQEASSNEANQGQIGWLDFEQAVVKSETVKKKIFIDVYTDWCGWCKRMDATTFKNDTVIHFLNQHYHAVKLNAETRDTIRFRDQVFVFRPEYKANEIALSLLSGKMGYPSFVILDENFAMLKVIAGYQTSGMLMEELRYYAGNRHLKDRQPPAENR